VTVTESPTIELANLQGKFSAGCKAFGRDWGASSLAAVLSSIGDEGYEGASSIGDATLWVNFSRFAVTNTKTVFRLDKYDFQARSLVKVLRNQTNKIGRC
jgi:hypothetical protein